MRQKLIAAKTTDGTVQRFSRFVQKFLN